MKELKKEELIKPHSGRMTVGQLKKFIEEHNISDDAVVMTQRIEDVYFENHGWGVYLKHGLHSSNALKWNEDVENGKYLDKEKYPNMDESKLKKFSDEDIKNMMEQYHTVFSCVYRENDKEFLFLDSHY